MVFRRGRMGLRPINSIKHIVEVSTLTAAVTNQVLTSFIDGVDAYSLADSNGVPTGAKVFSTYLSLFVFSEGGEVAAEIPLVDWYIIHNPGNAWSSTFDTNNLPTPGNTGTHKNKRHIIHTEKGLAGGGNASLAGVPMVFKGVIRIPKGMQRIGEDDRFTLCIRTNFISKVCFQFIYKHYK